jgi:hypothetical protein
MNSPSQNASPVTEVPQGSGLSGSPCSPVLSIRQPWAWLICNAGKDIENRSWPTKFRGRVLIHAGKGMTSDEYEDAGICAADSGISLPPFESLERGGIVGEAEIVDCVTRSESAWFFGPYGFVLRNAKPLPFFPCKGALGFFHLANDRSEVSPPATGAGDAAQQSQPTTQAIK